MTKQRLTLQEREALGYREHAGSISIRRAATPLPSIDWDAAIKRERSPLDMLLPMHSLSMLCSIHCFAILGRLAQHTDCVGPNEMTAGIILQCDDDLHLNAWGKKIPARAGDQFLLDPHRNHGAETKGLLVFAATDEDVANLPAADQSLSHFIRRLQLVADEFPLTKAAA